jgi:integrase
MPDGAALIRYDGKRGTVWRVKYRDAAGRQVMETLGAEREGWTEKKAAAELRERLVRVERKGYRRPQPLTFADAAERWRAETSVEKGWKPTTAAQYVSIVARLNRYFGPTRIGALRPSHVSSYKAEVLRNLSPASVSRDLSILHSILEWAVINEYIERNAAAGIKHPTLKQRKGVVLTPEQFGLLKRSFDDEQDRVLFLTLVLTALRRSEALALRWRDVSLSEQRLRVEDSKTETGIRSIAIPPALAAELEAHYQRTPFRGDEERVFAHPQRSYRFTYDHYRDSLERAFARAGLDWPEGFRPCHDLRVTGATNELLAGASKETLMVKLGHADFRTTQRYVNLAGVVFADEAAALERRMNGEPVESSTGLTAPERISDHLAALSEAEADGSY